MFEGPKDQHRWLEKFVGSWTSEMESQMGPDQPKERTTGSEVVRSLGGLWVVAEGQAGMPDGDNATTLMTLGFDPAADRFVGTFVASMMTHLWVYRGSLDAGGRILTLDTEGPDFTSGKMAKFRDIIEFVADDHRIMTSEALKDDGTWHHFMTAHYRRIS